MLLSKNCLKPKIKIIQFLSLNITIYFSNILFIQKFWYEFYWYVILRILFFVIRKAKKFYLKVVQSIENSWHKYFMKQILILKLHDAQIWIIKNVFFVLWMIFFFKFDIMIETNFFKYWNMFLYKLILKDKFRVVYP